MRTLLPALLAALLPIGCMVPTPPKDTAADAPVAEAPDRPQAGPPSPPEPPDPFEPPPAPPGLKGVDVVGHGLRITLFPPFQVSLADDFVPGFVEKGASNGLILSWWNVADPKAGGGHGLSALYNAGVAVHPVPEGADIVQGTTTWPDGRTGVTYRLGETGSYVLLPPELTAAGGMMTVASGPPDPTWAMEVDGVRTPLESGKIVHSADPAEGPGFVIDGRPHKPWGPWEP